MTNINVNVCSSSFSAQNITLADLNRFDELKSAVLTRDFENLKILLQQPVYSILINYRADGKTLLHLAADPERKDEQILRSLLDHGADPTVADYQDIIPLHLIVSEGTGCFCKKCTENAEECTKLLLEANSEIDTVNKKSHANYVTPFYYAAAARLSNCAILLLKYGADINLRPEFLPPLQIALSSSKGSTLPEHITWLLAHVPEVFETILDQSIVVDNNNSGNASAVGVIVAQFEKKLKIDFGIFLGHPKTTQSPRNPLPVPRQEGDFLQSVLNLTKNKSEERDKILSHPVTEVFMYKKDRALQIAFLVPQLFRLALAITYSFFVFGFYLYNCPYHDQEFPDNHTTSGLEVVQLPVLFTPFILSIQKSSSSARNYESINRGIDNCYPNPEVKDLAVVVLVFSIVISIYSIMKLIVKPYYCIRAWTFWIWILYLVISTFSLMPIFLSTYFDATSTDSYYYPMAAVGIFLAWSLLLNELGRIPFVGVHLEMLKKVVMTVLVCVFAYGLLVIGFAFGFHIMFPKNELFESPYLSFVKVLMLMVGDTDYDGIFRHSDPEDLLYSIPAHLFYGAFLIMITIIFMNLLIGLAVSDIQKLKAKAKIAKAISFIELLNLVEINLYSKRWDLLVLKWTEPILLFLKRRLSIVHEVNGEIKWHIEVPALSNAVTNQSSLRISFWPKDLPDKLHSKILDRYKSSCNCC